MRRAVVIAGFLVLVAVALVAVPALLTAPTTSEIAPDTTATDPTLIRPTGGESGFWPYLNSRRAFEQRSPINVVVIADSETVLKVLMSSGETDWEETPPGQREADPGDHAIVPEAEPGGNTSIVEQIELAATNITWTRASGGTRYAYVDPGDGDEGRWITETAQVHDGTYFGHRYHIRLYESPNPEEPWVVMQTHDEHFDWFTLRHRVHGSQAAQMRLEADLMALPQVDVTQDVRRVYLGNANAKDADGWATFVDLLGLAGGGLALALSTPSRAVDRLADTLGDHLTSTDRERLAAVRNRIMARHLMIAGTILGIILGVRIGGIAFERAGLLSMHGIAAVWYPVIGLGLPIGTYLLARGLDRRIDAGLVASSALAVAIWLDYALLGVATLPVDVIVQRMLVVVTLGLIAAGAARPAPADEPSFRLLMPGLLLWVMLLAGTLLGYL